MGKGIGMKTGVVAVVGLAWLGLVCAGCSPVETVYDAETATPEDVAPCLVDASTCLELLQSGKASEAFPSLVNLHEAGDAEASRLLGLMYFNGDGVERDSDKAMAYVTTASDAGNAMASFVLAEVQPTVEDHARVMLLAAEQGHLIAAQQIGLYYLRGEGVRVDKVKAYAWLFSVRIRVAVAVETYTKPLTELEEELSSEEKERGRVAAWNVVYIDTRTGWDQKGFDADNPNLTGHITVDNYEVVDGHLIVKPQADSVK